MARYCTITIYSVVTRHRCVYRNQNLAYVTRHQGRCQKHFVSRWPSLGRFGPKITLKHDFSPRNLPQPTENFGVSRCLQVRTEMPNTYFVSRSRVPTKQIVMVQYYGFAAHNEFTNFSAALVHQ